MRAIKFRGKDKKTGEIVYGILLKIPNAHYIIDSISWNDYYDTNNKYHKIILQDSSTDVTYHTPLRMCAVENDSIAQLIGIDKNGNEIYEGDEIKSRFGSSCYANFRHYGGIIDGAYSLVQTRSISVKE